MGPETRQFGEQVAQEQELRPRGQRDSNREPEPESEKKEMKAPENPPAERERDESSEEVEIVLVPYESLPVKEQQKITDLVLDSMRRVLRDIPDYALFASTAAYLHGKRMRALRDPNADAFLKTAPGDLDIAVGSIDSLNQIRERMGRMPGVYFENNGAFKQLPGERNKVLAGSMLMRVKNEQGAVHDVKYDFEFFNESRIVTDDAFRQRTQIEGVQVLSLEGLKTQYLNNLSLETQVDRKVQDVVDYLTGTSLREARHRERERARREEREPTDVVLPEGWVDPAAMKEQIMTGQVGPEVQGILDRLQVSAESLKRFYPLQEKIDSNIDEKEREALITQRSSLLSPGLKTKIPKRRDSIEKIQEAQRSELSGGLE